jgi:hypothetical protein
MVTLNAYDCGLLARRRFDIPEDEDAITASSMLLRLVESVNNRQICDPERLAPVGLDLSNDEFAHAVYAASDDQFSPTYSWLYIRGWRVGFVWREGDYYRVFDDSRMESGICMAGRRLLPRV